MDKTYSLELPDPRSYAFGALLQEIDGIFSGSREDDVTRTQTRIGDMRLKFSNEPDTPVALYYGRLDDDNLREWFLTSICRDHANHQKIASVGMLSFFS